MNINGYQWTFMNICKYLWIFVNVMNIIRNQKIFENIDEVLTEWWRILRSKFLEEMLPNFPQQVLWQNAAQNWQPALRRNHAQYFQQWVGLGVPWFAFRFTLVSWFLLLGVILVTFWCHFRSIFGSTGVWGLSGLPLGRSRGGLGARRSPEGTRWSKNWFAGLPAGSILLLSCGRRDLFYFPVFFFIKYNAWNAECLF